MAGVTYAAAGEGASLATLIRQQRFLTSAGPCLQGTLQTIFGICTTFMTADPSRIGKPASFQQFFQISFMSERLLRCNGVVVTFHHYLYNTTKLSHDTNYVNVYQHV